MINLSAGASIVGEGGSIDGDSVTGSSQRFSQSIGLLVLLTGLSWSGVQAPSGFQWFVDLLRLRELKVADFFGDGCALSNWVKLGHQLGLETASLLGVQVTGLLWDINKRCDDLIVAFLSSFLCDTTGTADLNWQFLALGVSNEFAGLLLNVLGCA